MSNIAYPNKDKKKKFVDYENDDIELSKDDFKGHRNPRKKKKDWETKDKKADNWN